MQYAIDTRLDEACEHAMLKIITAVPLPANPFFSLAADMRLASWRLELCGETPARLQQRLLQGAPAAPPVTAAAAARVHTVGSVAGLAAALRGTDTAAAASVLQLLRTVRCKPLPKRKGYTSAIVLSVTDRTLDYRRAMPHLSIVDAQEHVQVTGAHRGEAIDLYARHLLAHLKELVERRGGVCVVSSVQIGSTQWTASDLGMAAQEFAVCWDDYSSVLQENRYPHITYGNRRRSI